MPGIQREADYYEDYANDISTVTAGAINFVVIIQYIYQEICIDNKHNKFNLILKLYKCKFKKSYIL